MKIIYKKQMIILDLDKELNDSSHYENMASMQRRFITEIIKLKKEFSINGITANHLTVGNRILNFISDSNLFSPTSISIDSLKDFYQCGVFLQLNVYLDLNLPDNEMILSVSKDMIRDIKLDSILFDNDSIPFYSKHIKVNSIVI